MADEESRKPVLPQREPAQNVLNKFLKEKKIMLGTKQPEIERTPKGAMIIAAPQIIAVYSDELVQKDQSVN